MSEHDDMISAVRASVEQLSNETPEKEAPEKVVASEPESASERARDEKGRFVASETEQSETKPATETQETPVQAQSTAPALKPPTSWSADAKADFVKLPPHVQQAVLKREGEMATGQQQYSDERQRLKMLEGIIAPRRDYYQRFGFKNDVEAINHLFTISDSMERDPAGTIANLARHYGVDLTKLSGGAQQPPQQQFQPQPQPINIQEQVSEAVAMQFAKMTVQEFEQNAPEHYQDVKPLMQLLLEKGQASDLQDAYDKAIWMNPDIRTKMLEAQRSKEQQEIAAKQTAKVQQKVKAANASLNGAPHGTPATAPPKGSNRGQFGDVADDVRAAVSSLM